MKIRIITNSNETLKAVNAISNLDLSHGFSFGPDKNWELVSENSWFTNILKNLDSKLSKFFPLREKEKLVATEIANSAKKLNDYLAVHNNDTDSIDYLKNSSLFIHSDSSFNKMIREFSFKYARYANKLNLDYSVYKDSSTFKKILAGVQYISPAAFLESRKIVMNSSVFSKDTDISSGYNFLTDLSDKLGTQKIVDFTFLHEFAHITQDLNTTEFGVNSDIKMHKIVKNINSLAYDDFYFNSVKAQIEDSITQHHLTNNIEPPKFSPLDRDFIRQLDTVQREIYADVGGLLHMRNIAINEGTFNLNDFSQFIDQLIQARHSEHEAILSCHSDNIDKFDHFTVEGIKVLKEKLLTLDDKQILSQTDIHDACQDSLSIGLSRIMLTVASVHPELNSQIKNLFYLERSNFTASDGKEYPKITLNINQEDNPDTSKYLKGMEHLKKISGSEFVDRLTDTVHTTFSLKAPAWDVRQITWKSVFENPSYGNDLQELKDILNVSHQKNDFKINSTDEVCASISNLRNNFIAHNSKNKNTP